SKVFTSSRRPKKCRQLFGLRLDVKTFDLAPDHEVHDAVMPANWPSRSPGIFAVAQNHHAVGAAFDLAETVGNVNDADALLAQFADQFEQAFRLGQCEAGGRLVHDDDARIE